jgi:hypothetical protein
MAQNVNPSAYPLRARAPYGDSSADGQFHIYDALFWCRVQAPFASSQPVNILITQDITVLR